MEKKHYYTDERNAQIVIALLKAHGIKNVIASPGSSHAAFLASIQGDPWFTIFSAVDERHAAYMACGLAAETNKPVVLTCTGSTASRNYIPALTEAFYRKLPVLAITAAQLTSHKGNLYGQYMDRRQIQFDVVRYSFHCAEVITDHQALACGFEVNKAILELFRHGGGPVHINLESRVLSDFHVKELPKVRKISRIFSGDETWPRIPSEGKIVVFIGAHRKFDDRQKSSLEHFLLSYNAVAFCDATSSYFGVKRVVPSIVCSQREMKSNSAYRHLNPDLIIHIGEICNDYSTNAYLNSLAPVWRVSPDGELRDRFGMLENVFEMDERTFFEHYSQNQATERNDSFAEAWQAQVKAVASKFNSDVIPFSNVWIAHNLVARIPRNSILHLGVSTTLQSWNSQLYNEVVQSFANVGCCGIDGSVSTMVGASLANPGKLCFGVVGDLSFFYDMNAVGNRHIRGNFRLLVVNNNGGALFYHPGHGIDFMGDERGKFFAATGHFAHKSKSLVKHYAEDLGFKYLSAETKEEFLKEMDEFFSSEISRPILFECFTEIEAERDAWGYRVGLDGFGENILHNVAKQMRASVSSAMPKGVKAVVKGLLK